MVDQTLGGRYRTLKLLGQGGFGVTFLAEDIQRPGNPKCVVKQFKPMATEPKAFEAGKRLFHREAQTLEKLGGHEQIPRLLAHFEEEQQFYLVQEYIEGHDLEQELLSGQKFSEDEVIKLLQEILEILIFVHQNNHIHRDIKPSNIRRRSTDGKIVLIDFGAVKQISTQVVNPQGITSYSVAIGTRGYMPGEQAQGFAQFNSDIYALGIIAIQALTGTTPNKLVTNHHTGEITWRQNSNLVVNPELGDILDKMVRYDFRERYRSAKSVMDDLKRISNPFLNAKLVDRNRHLRRIRLIRDSLSSNTVKILIGLGLSAGLGASLFVWKKLNIQTAPLQIAQPAGNLSTQHLSTYDNNSWGIKIQYPKNWQRQDIENPITTEVVIFSSPKQDKQDKFQENLTISVRKFSGTLEESQELFKSNVQNNLPGAEIIKYDKATLGSNRGKKLVFTGDDGEKRLKNLLVWTLKDGKAYIITYTAAIDEYDNFLQIANSMIESFEIK